MRTVGQAFFAGARLWTRIIPAGKMRELPDAATVQRYFLMRHVNDRQFHAVSALAGPERYSHFVRQAADWEELWSMKSSDGWVLMTADDGQELVPVWPHPRYAAACSSPDWGDAVPTAIPLNGWLERWTPGLLRDGRRVAVFPLPGGQGVVVSPERLRDDLAAEEESYG